MPTPSWPYPFWIAHRGAGRQAPENTLAALRLGLALGWKAFEVDAKLSADSVPFLLHDTTLDRTTTESGRASDRAWAELSTLDAGTWHHSEHAFEPIPSLTQVMNFVFSNDCGLNIEIKPTPGDEDKTGEVVAHQALHDWNGAVERARQIRKQPPPPPLLSSFQPASLEAARRVAASLPRALLVNRAWPQWIDQAVALECSACVVQHEMVDAPMVEALKARGLKVWVYTVNEVEEARMLVRLGVDGLITDAVHVFDPQVNPRVDPRGVTLQGTARF